jgi:hypothetical protein
MSISINPLFQGIKRKFLIWILDKKINEKFLERMSK